MADLNSSRQFRMARLLTQGLLSAPVIATLFTAQQAQAQRAVSACSGASLPRSVVTDILRPVITGIATPTENIVNDILDLPLVGGLLGDLDLNATGLLDQAASGAPISLDVLTTDGTILGPGEACRATSDSITLNTPAGVAIGGNQITGLGANGAAAFASDINAIAFGNSARAEAGALGSIALGNAANVTAANSVALGAGSTAARGALAGYAALGLAGPQTSAGEVSVGTAGGLRQITNVAAGTAASDAATVGQVQGVADQIAAIGAGGVQYDNPAVRDRVTLTGAAGTVIGNVAPGAVTATSTEAVNGGQLFATNTQVATNTGAITAIDARVTSNTTLLNDVAANAVRYDDAGRAIVTFGGAGGTVLANVAAGELSGTSTQAVNGAQLFATNQQVGTNTTNISNLGDQITNINTQVGDIGANAIRYNDATRAAVTLGGAAGTTIDNLAAGTLSAASTQAVNGSQLFATNQRVDANTGAITTIDARVTVNETDIADLSTDVTNNTNLINALSADAVRYDDAGRGTITLAGAGGTRVTNVTAGTLSATSTDAVNGAQLFATNQQIAAISAGAAGALRYSDAGTPTTPNGGTVTDDTTLVGASGGAVGLHNVRGGALAAGSTDAVNGDQLFATNQRVDANTGAITSIDARVTTNEANIANLQTNVAGNNTTITNLQTQVANNTTSISSIGDQVNNLAANALQYDDATRASVTLAGAGGTTINNVAAGTLSAGSTQAVNGSQLFATNEQVAANTTAITNINNTIAGSTVSAVQYSNPATPTTPNGGIRTNDVTLVGVNAAAPVALHNVAGGAVAAGSTDAVNGDQLFAVQTQAANSVQYDRNAAGNRTNTLTLAGGEAGAVTINNVANGAVAAGSAQAVNGGQLYATQQIAQQAAALGANSVQYDAGNTSVTFNSTGSAVVLRNVAAGTATTDAVNVGQLQTGLQGAVNASMAYTDQRLGQALASMSFNLRGLKRDLRAGSSTALAAAALPQATEPGRSMVAVGTGTYGGEVGFAFGASTFLDDGHSIVRLGATVDSRGKGGANAGVGYQF